MPASSVSVRLTCGYFYHGIESTKILQTTVLAHTIILYNSVTHKNYSHLYLLYNDSQSYYYDGCNPSSSTGVAVTPLTAVVGGVVLVVVLVTL